MRLPDWIKIKPFDRKKYAATLDLINEHRLNTVCLSGNCPNRYECFSRGTATFMILGNVCTRHCLYCNIASGRPAAPDPGEPARVARAVKKLGLKYAVITAVSRDDLPDNGAAQYAETAGEIKKAVPECRLELLISDLGGDPVALKTVAAAGPDVVNHNLETVARLFPKLRPQGGYERSLSLLRRIKKMGKKITTKSGLMAGLGESREEILSAMRDLRAVDCDRLTIGQYLAPSPAHAPIEKYYRPEEFAALAAAGRGMGFKNIQAGPLVRSSYRAGIIGS